MKTVDLNHTHQPGNKNLKELTHVLGLELLNR